MTDSWCGVRPKPLLSLAAILGCILFGSVPFIIPAHASAAGAMNVWWPVDGAHVTGTQPFKAMVSGLDVSAYDMYWRVDGGQWNLMANSYDAYQHKEASVDLSGWTWHGSGPYVIDFSARKNGVEVAASRVSIVVDNGLPAWSPPSAAPAAAAGNDPLSSMRFFVNPDSSAAKQAIAWQDSYPAGAQMMRVLAGAPEAAWFGDWNGNVAQDAQALVSRANAAGSVPVTVAYDIPERDCGGFSSGGTDNPDGYRAWINAFASGLGSGNAVVVLEPDALAQMGCLSPQDQQARLSLLSYAVGALKSHAGVKVYLDAGHSGWIDAATMAARLRDAGIASADGFALNVSNYLPTDQEIAYGTDLSGRLGGAHFVIDTSRNGAGSDGQWCNPPGRAIGTLPTTTTGNPLVDAFLWVKTPGESDGYCNGGPAAGAWWPAEAVSLVANAR